MERSRFKLPQDSWGSTVSKYAPTDNAVGPDDFTSGTKNIETEIDGTLSKRRGDINYELSAQAGTIKDLYEAIFVDGTHHSLRLRSGTLEYSSGNGVYNLVTAGFSPIGNFEFATYLDRVYGGNGIDQPIVYDKTAVYGGVTYTVPKTKQMGAQAPATAPTAAVGAVGNVPAGTYQYKVTFLYYGFEESNGGLASNVVSPAIASQINLTSVPIGGYGVESRKIYRTNDGGLSYFLVGIIQNNTATVFTDNLLTPTLDIPLDNGTPRNFTLIAQNNGRNWIAGIPGAESELDYSEAGLPDIFSSTGTVFCEAGDPIRAIKVYNGKIVVLNRNSFGQILGSSPDTYRYSPTPGRTGCVDTRSVQIRVIRGVPILVWLGAKGFYAWNGSSVEYISDDIEDLVNFNIQQASSVKGSNSQSTQSDFLAGYYVANGGIDLVSDPGVITTPNPKNLVDEQTEWEGGSSTDAIVTRRTDIPNQLAQAKRATFLRSAGSNAGTIINAGNLELPIVVNANNLAESDLGDLQHLDGFGFRPSETGQPVYFVAPGTLTGVSLRLHNTLVGTAYYKFAVWANDGTNKPGTLLYTSPNQSVPNGFLGTVSHSLALSLGTGLYFVGFQNTDSGGSISGLNISARRAGGASAYRAYILSAYGALVNVQTFRGAPWKSNVNEILFAFSATTTTAGTWTSAAHTSGLFPNASGITVNLNHVASYPAGSASTSFVDEADDVLITAGVVTQSVASLNGTQPFTFTPTKAFWRVRIVLTAVAVTASPSITSDPTITFPTSVTWIGPSIDNTLGISAMNTLLVSVGLLPAGTTATAVVQKSTLVGSGFADEGSFPLVLGLNTLNLVTVTNPLKRFTRLKLVLDNSAAPTLSPEITSIELHWSITTSFYSQAIDTGATPAGWDIFQASVNANGGSVAFGMRSATTAIQLTDDVPAGPFVPAFVAVTNGLFPTSVPLNEFTQFVATITSSADRVPTIDSVTINWFISLGNSVRAASIFADKEYYCSLATYNSTVNNVLLKLDRDGKWRVWYGQSIGTLSYFFDEVFFGDASTAIVRKFLSGTTDHDNAIELDVRLKAFDFETSTKSKILRKVFVVFANTGATYDVSYSLDEGITFLPLKDAQGNTSFTVPSNNLQTSKRLVPFGSNLNAGKSILVRIHENTTNVAQIIEVQLDAYTRQGDIIDG